jgi:hypothetical protein
LLNDDGDVEGTENSRESLLVTRAEAAAIEAAGVPKYNFSAMERNTPISIININAPKGSLQVGDSNIATVKHQWTQESRDGLICALLGIENAIRSKEMSATLSKDDLLALVKEAKDETGKEMPDASRLIIVLSKIGATIRTVGSMPGAYLALKVAAKAIGIQLP